MKQLENINNAKFDALTKEQLSTINGGLKTEYRDGRVVTRTDERGSWTSIEYDVYTAHEFLGMRISSWEKTGVAYSACTDNCW